MRKLLTGLLLLGISFGFDFFPVKTTALTVAYASTFCLSLYYIYDGIILVVKGKQYAAYRPRRFLRHILIAGVIAGVATEALGNWLFKFWIYPHFSPVFYLLVVPVSLCLYFFILFENYVAIHTVLQNFFPTQHFQAVKRSTLHTTFFSIIGFLGVMSFTFVSITKLLAYQLPSSMLKIFNTYWISGNDIASLFLLCFSIWGIFEYLQYQRNEDTLLTHMIHGDFTAFLSIIFASLVTSVIMEIFNIPIKIWVYTNVPYQQVLLFGVPLIILLLWPFQYLLFGCLYHFVYKKETETIWS